MKKLALILLSLVMVLSVVIVPATAAAPAGVPTPATHSIRDIQAYWWNINGYKWIGYDFLDGTISEANRAPALGYPTASSVDLATTDATDLQVATLDDLIAIRNAVNGNNTLAGKTFHQTANIDLAGLNWTPIGYKTATDTYTFGANYNGWGYEIQNLTIDANTNDVAGLYTVGLFGYAANNAKVSWLVVTNPQVMGITYGDTNTPYRTGAICGEGGTFAAVCIQGDENSYVKGSVNVGGIVGKCGEVIKRAQNTNVNVHGLSNWTSVAGICGFGGWISQCYNGGNITTVSGQSVYGGIGTTQVSQAEYCINAGNVTAWCGGAGTAGGIVGTLWGGGYSSNNINYGEISFTAGSPSEEIGAIYGTLRNPATTITNLYNYGACYRSAFPMCEMVGAYTNNATEESIDWTTCEDASLANLLDVRYQISDDNSAVRYNVCLDDLAAYDRVVFVITAEGYGTAEVEVRNAFTSLYGADAEYTPASVCGTDVATAFSTFTLTDIPAGTVVTVTAKVLPSDGWSVANPQYGYAWYYSNSPVTLTVGA